MANSHICCIKRGHSDFWVPIRRRNVQINENFYTTGDYMQHLQIVFLIKINHELCQFMIIYIAIWNNINILTCGFNCIIRLCNCFCYWRYYYISIRLFKINNLLIKINNVATYLIHFRLNRLLYLLHLNYFINLQNLILT